MSLQHRILLLLCGLWTTHGSCPRGAHHKRPHLTTDAADGTDWEPLRRRESVSPVQSVVISLLVCGCDESLPCAAPKIRCGFSHTNATTPIATVSILFTRQAAPTVTPAATGNPRAAKISTLPPSCTPRDPGTTNATRLTNTEKASIVKLASQSGLRPIHLSMSQIWTMPTPNPARPNMTEATKSQGRDLYS